MKDINQVVSFLVGALVCYLLVWAVGVGSAASIPSILNSYQFARFVSYAVPVFLLSGIGLLIFEIARSVMGSKFKVRFLALLIPFFVYLVYIGFDDGAIRIVSSLLIPVLGYLGMMFFLLRRNMSW
ncbi:hypothetical protein [Biformimicrobium ophioploci]|uniref:Uncharacterized protein n=1 Tax=Biformimicrobium ophioploci TaxID=3036711 RepID=A0ABQ6LXB2_9GAMM|nr:hypothetical protein [Microbulbifer sp. NKW57]GMG86728.1 hypothetical protein MNKW57_10490 [Microbulbifer sp. NKW57]